MPKILNIAVVGAGTMAQAVHLPVLRRRWDRFTVAALVDHSPRRRREAAEVWGIEEARRHETVADLVAAVRARVLSVDAVLLSPEGIVGWAATIGQLVTRRRIGHSRVDHVQGEEVRVVSDKPVEIEIDGDTLGSATAMRVLVQPASLLVRIPAGRRQVRDSIDALTDRDHGGREHDSQHPHHDDRVAHEH